MEWERREGALRWAEGLLGLAQGDRSRGASVLVEADDPYVWCMLCGRSAAAVGQIDAWMARALTARSKSPGRYQPLVGADLDRLR